LFDEAVGSFSARVERRTRNGENLAALFEREPGGDQRSRAFGGLDNDDAKRPSGNETIAPRKIACSRLPSDWHFTQRDAGAKYFIE
jgi:hypothetical protein